MILSMHLVNQKQAYALVQQLWKVAKAKLAKGENLIVEIHNAQDKATALQRRYYHGVVLKEIAKQIKPGGRQYSLEVWKEHLRKSKLGTEIVTIVDPLSGIEYKEERRVSTEDLGVKGYSELIEDVTAWAVADWGVRFPMDYHQWLAYEEKNGASFEKSRKK